MREIFIFLLIILLNYGTRSEMHLLDVDLHQSYTLKCKIKDVNIFEACFLKNPQGETAFWRDYTGRCLSLEEDRIVRIESHSICGLEVQYSRKGRLENWYVL